VILVYLETAAGTPSDLSLQSLTLARSLGDELTTTTFGPGGDWVIDHQMFSEYAPEARGEALAQLTRSLTPAVVVGPGTDTGNEVMAHLAAILDVALATNVTEVDVATWELTRLRWGGSLWERARLTGSPRLLTVAPHVLPASDHLVGEVSRFVPELDDLLVRTRVVERVEQTGGITLGTARVIISGGRGVGSADGFSMLEELAARLGGAVGCSRVVTNNGWRPHSDQVGQTGTRVAPDLYLALGISGAIQHWVGMMAAKKILAINTDPEAPMVTKADYAVIGDLHQVLPAILAEIEARTRT